MPDEKIPPDKQMWEVAEFRVTLLPIGEITPAGLDWWHLIVGGAPAAIREKPGESEWQADGFLAADRPALGRLLLRVNPRRVDWLLRPDQNLDDPARLARFPSVGQLGERAAQDFLAGVQRWIASVSFAVGRLAVAPTFISEVEDRVAGYKFLSSFLPFQLDPDSSDFFYQINRPRPSTTNDSVIVNTLSKWSTMRVRRGEIDPTALRITGDQGHFAARLELDVNTADRDGEEITNDELLPMFAELIATTVDIAARGVRDA